MTTKKNLFVWTALYLLVAYAIGLFGLAVSGGGHGDMAPLRLYFILGMPTSLVILILLMMGGHVTSGSDYFTPIQEASNIIGFLLPLLNAALIWLIAWILSTQKRRKSSRISD